LQGGLKKGKSCEGVTLGKERELCKTQEKRNVSLNGYGLVCAQQWDGKRKGQGTPPNKGKQQVLLSTKGERDPNKKKYFATQIPHQNKRGKKQRKGGFTISRGKLTSKICADRRQSI